jgi:hypothetical protein
VAEPAREAGLEVAELLASLAAGHPEEAARRLAAREEEWRRRPPGRQGSGYEVAELALDRAELGDADGAFAWLDRLVAQPDGRLMTLQVLAEPVLDPLRGDPRFHDLLARARAAESFALAGRE